MPKTLEEALAIITSKDAKIKEMEVSIAKKDTLIAQKTDDIVKLRKSINETTVPKEEFKKLKDMTDAEKAAMSESELALKKQIESMQAADEKRKADEQEMRTKERNERIENEVKRLAGSDQVLGEKIKAEMTKLKGYDEAQLGSEIAKVAQDAYNMLGSPRPTGVGAVVNHDGTSFEPGGDTKTTGDFTESAEGKALASIMGLNIEPTK